MDRIRCRVGILSNGPLCGAVCSIMRSNLRPMHKNVRHGSIRAWSKLVGCIARESCVVARDVVRCTSYCALHSRCSVSCAALCNAQNLVQMHKLPFLDGTPTLPETGPLKTPNGIKILPDQERAT